MEEVPSVQTVLSEVRAVVRESIRALVHLQVILGALERSEQGGKDQVAPTRASTGDPRRPPRGLRPPAR
jgi:hypothetical protein